MSCRPDFENADDVQLRAMCSELGLPSTGGPVVLRHRLRNFYATQVQHPGHPSHPGHSPKSGRAVTPMSPAGQRPPGTAPLAAARAKHVDRLTAEEVRRIVSFVTDDGYVILRNAVSAKSLSTLDQALREQALSVVDDARSHSVPLPQLHSPGHFSLEAPLEAIPSDLLGSRIAHQVLLGLLSNKYKLTGISAHTNIPCSTVQPIHVEAGQLWHAVPNPTPPHSITVTVFPQATTEDTGSVELFPGTHKDSRKTVYDETNLIDPTWLRNSERIPTSVRANAAIGDVLITDSRLWRREMPNNGSQPLSAIHLTFSPFWASLPQEHELELSEELLAAVLDAGCSV
eukprot:NODE_834_length_1160_cov_140.733785_g792_i0.p1 GENE.NODE_834_length_1160_cov_140.733785_g792_i0~~NODE_834_length_1160_cov_140.733785_g792_i0.p1  ORF type:complete len:343 (-),score=49.50 NODE_834_length_1160_cov_140.733785_g792_i0:52-1080(-)